ncbi:hypothetical protein D3C75_1117250 [compost metagenome]
MDRLEEGGCGACHRRIAEGGWDNSVLLGYREGNLAGPGKVVHFLPLGRTVKIDGSAGVGVIQRLHVRPPVGTHYPEKAKGSLRQKGVDFLPALNIKFFSSHKSRPP